MTQVPSTAQTQNCISLFSSGILAHDSSSLSCLNSKLNIFLFCRDTGKQLRYIVQLEFKTTPLCFLVAHWQTTQVHCKALIQNYISFFSGGTLTHDSSMLNSGNSKLHLFVFGWHTGTQLKSTVLLELKTVSLSFWVAHWHTTQEY
jgi:hypothetical protein